jgi:hypothetical protein
MRRYLGSLIVGLGAVVALCAAPATALAQGVTGSALAGTIQEEGGGVVPGAQVHLRNTSTGETFNATSGAEGEFFFDNIPSGGPYLLTAQAEGYQLTSQGGINVTLGQRLNVDLELKFQMGEVEEIVIVEQIDKLHDSGRTGMSTTVGEAALGKQPLQSRNFTDLIQTAPGVTGNSIAGQNNRFNNIQIDGGANNDLFGLSGSGTPGGVSNAKPISIEAIKEFVVQIAPFDVRQGSFTGGLVNAITRSGTNDFHGGVFGYFQNKSLAGFRDDPTFLDYNTWQFGGSLGGPIIKDKLHFFVSADLQERSVAFGNQFQIGGVDSAADIMRAGFDLEQAERVRSILITKYGFPDPGTALSPDLANPDRNVFAKLSTSAIKNSRLELSYNLVDARQDELGRNPTNPVVPGSGLSVTLRDGYQLSNSGYEATNRTHTVRGKMTTTFGKISNEFLASASIIRDAREMADRLPLILVRMGRIGARDSFIAAGGERFSHQNELDQDIFQLQDNVTLGLGAHRLTVGTSNEFLNLYNLFHQAHYGVWAFNSVDDLDAGVPTAYQRRTAFQGATNTGVSEFNVAQLGLYVQDEWTVMKNLVVTGGVRIDVPFLSEGATNERLLASPLAIDTGDLPSGNILWSPRLGLNWDVLGDASTIIRGGAGIFTGRPPYVWVSNAYSVNGLSHTEFTCRPMAAGGSGIPTFNTDPDAQPTDCMGNTTLPAGPANVGEVDYFDPDTRYPQSFRAALGFDRRLPWDIIGSLDLLYTTDVNGWYTTDANLTPLGLSGEDRQLYGTFGMMGFAASPMRVDTMNLRQAVKVYNKSGGGVFNATIQGSKNFIRRENFSFDANVAYTYTRARDLISFTSSQAFSNLQFAPLDGTLEERNSRPSAFERPHKISITGNASLPYGFGVGLNYVGQSGLPYTWTVAGDVNADGMSSNDIVFVPANESQISLYDDPNNPNDQWANLDAFIESQDCLKNARGRLLKRGECRNPWANFVNLRLSWTSPELYKGGHRLEVQFDIFNLMNLLNSDWGLFDRATDVENHRSAFLGLNQSRAPDPPTRCAPGYDAANNRPIYCFQPPSTVENTIYSPTTSRWRMQLGARYTF